MCRSQIFPGVEYPIKGDDDCIIPQFYIDHHDVKSSSKAGTVPRTLRETLGNSPPKKRKGENLTKNIRKMMKTSTEYNTSRGGTHQGVQPVTEKMTNDRLPNKFQPSTKRMAHERNLKTITREGLRNVLIHVKKYQHSTHLMARKYGFLKGKPPEYPRVKGPIVLAVSRLSRSSMRRRRGRHKQRHQSPQMRTGRTWTTALAPRTSPPTTPPGRDSKEDPRMSAFHRPGVEGD